MGYGVGDGDGDAVVGGLVHRCGLQSRISFVSPHVLHLPSWLYVGSLTVRVRFSFPPPHGFEQPFICVPGTIQSDQDPSTQWVQQFFTLQTFSSSRCGQPEKLICCKPAHACLWHGSTSYGMPHFSVEPPTERSRVRCPHPQVCVQVLHGCQALLPQLV